MAAITRRAVLGWLGAVGAVLIAPAGGFVTYLYVKSGRSNTGELTFANQVRIPPLLAPTADSDGGKRFRMELQEGTSELLPGKLTRTWGANGPILGPTLRATRGERVAIEVTNRLPETTTVHWHGMHLPAEMDGGPHQPIPNGATWRPTWTIAQRAATLWYHPHLHQTTAQHVYRGVAGLFLIDDPATADLPLPSQYGVDDVPVIIQDRNFTEDGQLDMTDMNFSGLTVTGLLGQEILINGTHNPHFPVTAELTRFRLLNGSNARVYDIGFTDDRDFSLIATDSGLLATPQRMNRLLLSPGERAEIVVRCRPGEEVIMRSFPPTLGANFAYERLAGGDDTHDLLKLVAASSLRPSPPLPAKLGDEPPPPKPTITAPFRLEMGDFTFNGKTMGSDRLDRVVRTDAVEVWEIVNGQAIPHNFHVHGSAFHVLDVNGRKPPARWRGEKDTVFVAPGNTLRLAVRFLPYSDPRHPYMFHCHILAHEDAGMMGQFMTVSEKDAPLVSTDGLSKEHVGHGG